MPEVSVVILNWNGAHLLPVCLDSVRAQTFRDFDVRVVDNGSTDGSIELLTSTYPEVKLIRFGENIGFSLAVNAGLEQSGGRFVVLLNNDTELDPRCFEELLGAIHSDDRLGMCAPKMIYYDRPDLINSAGHACGPDGIVVDIGRGEPDGEWFDRPREVLGACAGAALYRRRMLDEVGLFERTFFISFEDADLNWRAQWAGWRARSVPTALVRHREGVSREIRSRRAVFLGLRNAVDVWVKDWPALALAKRFFAIWNGWRRSTASLMRRGHGAVLPAVVWGVYVHLPRMLLRRRAIRRTRTVPRSRFDELLAMGAAQTRQPPED